MTLSEISRWLLVIIPVSAIPRGIHCAVKIGAGGDDSEACKHRLKNLLIFVAVAEAASAFMTLISYYFSPGAII